MQTVQLKQNDDKLSLQKKNYIITTDNTKAYCLFYKLINHLARTSKLWWTLTQRWLIVNGTLHGNLDINGRLRKVVAVDVVIGWYHGRQVFRLLVEHALKIIIHNFNACSLIIQKVDGNVNDVTSEL